MGTAPTSCSISWAGLNGDWQIHSCGKFGKIGEVEMLESVENFGTCTYVCCLWVCLVTFKQ